MPWQVRAPDSLAPSVVLTVRAKELLDGIQDQIPSFQGLKFSDTDLLDFGQCVDQHGPHQMALLFGVDEVGALGHPMGGFHPGQQEELSLGSSPSLPACTKACSCLFPNSSCWVHWRWEPLGLWAGESRGHCMKSCMGMG